MKKILIIGLFCFLLAGCSKKETYKKINYNCAIDKLRSESTGSADLWLKGEIECYDTFLDQQVIRSKSFASGGIYWADNRSYEFYKGELVIFGSLLVIESGFWYYCGIPMNDYPPSLQCNESWIEYKNPSKFQLNDGCT